MPRLSLRKWRKALRRVPCSPGLENPVVLHGGDQPEGGELPDPARAFPRDTGSLQLCGKGIPVTHSGCLMRSCDRPTVPSPELWVYVTVPVGVFVCVERECVSTREECCLKV